MSEIMPSPELWDAFAAADPDQPVAMINLLKFKDKATYAPDRPEAAENLSGFEAYMRYGLAVMGIFQEIGAKLVFNAPVARVMIGAGAFDSSAIAWYPNRRALIGMEQRADFQAAHYHREAGLAHQMLIETTPGIL